MLNWSIFEIFKVGLGPSSSHTVGPMKAASAFVFELCRYRNVNNIRTVDHDTDTKARLIKIEVHLFGSLAFTGLGHGTDKAILLGLEGYFPESIDVDFFELRSKEIYETNRIQLAGKEDFSFSPKEAIFFHFGENLPLHSNGMRFVACFQGGTSFEKTYYSIGGGQIIEEGVQDLETVTCLPPYPFHSATEFLAMCKATGFSVSTLMKKNELFYKNETDFKLAINGGNGIWQVMKSSIERGCSREGILPGGLKVRRRAPSLYRKLKASPMQSSSQDSFALMEWVNLYALAVNEENAAGGKIVTAPTNGASGVIPAVLNYLVQFSKMDSEDIIEKFLLTSGAIGLLYKKNASVSGAEVGCQGEVGVACSMAAAGLAEVWGGTPEQVENAAEIGMEHNLGLTCDPVGGLVQIPCIERNAMAAVKAINAARLALRGDGSHFVSLDKVILTMKQTGADMKTQYKETSQGGLAVNVPEC